MWVEAEFRRRIAFFERNLKRSGLATEAELAAVATRSAEWAVPERLIYQWADLRALVTERNRTTLDPDALEAAVRAMEERPEHVSLPSVQVDTIVRPASFARINLVELYAYNLKLLTQAREFLMAERTAGRTIPTDPTPCSECGRPLAPGGVFELIDKMGREIVFERAALHTQIIAEGPEPHEGPLVTWSERITQGEHMLLIQAYHRVNTDPIKQVSGLVSKDGKRDLPNSWSFLFNRFEEREGRPARHIMRDRSLASIIAVCVTSALLSEERERTTKRKAASEKHRRVLGKRPGKTPIDRAVDRGQG